MCRPATDRQASNVENAAEAAFSSHRIGSPARDYFAGTTTIVVSPPVLPCSPFKPSGPIMPGDPVIPGDPTIPVAPMVPALPSAPCGPAGPGTGTITTAAGAGSATTDSRWHAPSTSTDRTPATTNEYFMTTLSKVPTGLNAELRTTAQRLPQQCREQFARFEFRSCPSSRRCASAHRGKGSDDGCGIGARLTSAAPWRAAM